MKKGQASKGHSKMLRGDRGRRKAGAPPPKRTRRKLVSLGFAVRFQPPRIFVSDEEYLIPLVHRNKADLRSLARILDGSTFYVKAVQPRPESAPVGYMVMAKLKRAKSS